MILVVMVLAAFCWNLAAAQTVELRVENQSISGTVYSFDIYMRATVGTVYWFGADLVLTFNNANFTSPVCARAAVTGNWVLDNTLGDGTTSLGGTVSASYRGATSPAAITGNEIIINVNSPSFVDQDEFDANVAVIDAAMSHKIGRYTISGISNAAGTMGLAWKTSGGGVVTAISTCANTSPWAASTVTLDVSPLIPDVLLPVELTSFTASANRLTAQLAWTTATEKNNFGFDVERRIMGSDASAWTKVGFVTGSGTKSTPTEYTYTDRSVTAGRYAYRIKQIDNDGTFKYAQAAEVEVGLAAKVLTLTDAYPNPFNPATLIEFTLPQDGRATLKVYNTIGQEVANLFDGEAAAGRIIQARFDAKSLASGIYFARLEFDGKSMLRKMLLMK